MALVEEFQKELISKTICGYLREANKIFKIMVEIFCKTLYNNIQLHRGLEG